MEQPNFLYKYQSFSINTLTALKDSSLWFAKFNTLNDAFERVYGYVPSMDVINNSIFKNMHEMESALIENTGVCSFSLMNPLHKRNFKNSALMWAHYASQFSGICIEFKADVLLGTLEVTRSKDNLIHSNPVIYKKSPYIIGAQGQSNTHDIFYRKHIAWAYEKEFRAVSLWYDGLVSYSAKAIKRVFIGGRMPNENISLLKLVLKSINPEVKLLMAGFVDSSYSFEFIEV